MIYNLATQLDKERFIARAKVLLEKGSAVDLTEKTPRSRNQNHYLHLLLGVVAMEVGETIDYVKEEYFKKLVNRDLFVREKSDKYIGKVQVILSSTQLTTEEMSMAIDRFKKWGAEQGFYLPNPDDTSLLQMIDIDMGRMRQYL